MKRYWLLSFFVFLSGCAFVTPAIPKVVVSPSSVVLGRGESLDLTATLDSGSATNFSWSVEAGAGSFNDTNGTSATGTKVKYTAPQNDGDYKVTVSAVGVEATSAVLTITVVEQVSATGAYNVDTPLRSGVINPNSSKRYIIQTGGLTKPLLKLEVGTSQSVTLKVFDANNQLLATSNNKTFFTKEPTPVNSQGLEPQIVLPLRCDGPCVAIPRTGERYIVLIEAGNAQVSYRFDAYEDAYAEDTEPANNTCVDSDALPGGEGNYTEVGAIETLGDVDCFNTVRPVGTVRLVRTAGTTLNLKAEITNLTTNRVDTLEVKQTDSATEQVLTFAPAAPVKIVVTSSDGRAGPSENSIYNVVFK